jgi:hypothetical protein
MIAGDSSLISWALKSLPVVILTGGIGCSVAYRVISCPFSDRVGSSRCLTPSVWCIREV